MEKILVKTIDDFLRGAQFQKRGHAWYRSLDEVWHVVSLRRDYSWSDRYSLSFGVFLKRLGSTREYPKEQYAHIRCGVQKIMGPAGDRFRYEVMDFGKPMDEKLRIREIVDCLQKTLDDFFARSGSEAVIAANFRSGYFAETLFHSDARAALKLS